MMRDLLLVLFGALCAGMVGIAAWMVIGALKVVVGEWGEEQSER